MKSSACVNGKNIRAAASGAIPIIRAHKVLLIDAYIARTNASVLHSDDHLTKIRVMDRLRACREHNEPMCGKFYGVRK